MTCGVANFGFSLIGDFVYLQWAEKTTGENPSFFRSCHYIVNY